MSWTFFIYYVCFKYSEAGSRKVTVRMRKSRLKEIKLLFQSHRASGGTGKSPESALTYLMLLLPLKNARHVLGNAALAAANRVSTGKNNSF